MGIRCVCVCVCVRVCVVCNLSNLSLLFEYIKRREIFPSVLVQWVLLAVKERKTVIRLFENLSIRSVGPALDVGFWETSGACFSRQM